MVDRAMRKANPMRAVLTILAAASLAASAVAQEAAPSAPQPAPAAASASGSTAAPADGALQVIRPGDSQMSCEALIAEANALNARVNEQQNALSDRAMDSTRGMMRAQQAQSGVSTAMSLGSMLGSMIPGVGLALGAAQAAAGVAQQAAAAAQRQQMMNDVDQMMSEAQASSRDLMPLMNRADHLSDLSMAKGC